MAIILLCSQCGSDEAKLPLNLSEDDVEALNIQCKCGKWLVKDGAMGRGRIDETKR